MPSHGGRLWLKASSRTPWEIECGLPTEYLPPREIWPIDTDINNPRDYFSLEQVARAVAQKGRKDSERMHRAALKVG